MATKTKNYNLIKPDLTDDADIRVINGNMDVLDNKLKNISDTANDVNNKLPLTGGTMTGAIKTADNIYKNTNNGVLTLSGSTDASHGGRIDLSGEKQSGRVKITADNGTDANVFEVSADWGGSKYTFNDIPVYMNSSTNYFRFGPDGANLRLGKDKVLYSDAIKFNFNGFLGYFNNTNDYFNFGVGNHYLAYNRNDKLYFSYDDTGNKTVQVAKYVQSGTNWYFETDTILVQGGTWIPYPNDTYVNVTLPRPYANTNYTVLVADNTTRNSIGLSNFACTARKISGTTIALDYYADREVAWMTWGVK